MSNPYRIVDDGPHFPDEDNDKGGKRFQLIDNMNIAPRTGRAG